MERLVRFIPISDHTGNKLTEIVLGFVEDKGISLKNLRGQSYDNASNMSGKHKALQAIIIERKHLVE